MPPDWVRKVRDQCVAAGVPFFFKQWGEWVSDSQHSGYDDPYRFYMKVIGNESFYRVGKHRAGRLLDGRTWDELPGKESK
jgi:protein gp37